MSRLYEIDIKGWTYLAAYLAAPVFELVFDKHIHAASRRTTLAGRVVWGTMRGHKFFIEVLQDALVEESSSQEGKGNSYFDYMSQRRSGSLCLDVQRQWPRGYAQWHCDRGVGLH